MAAPILPLHDFKVPRPPAITTPVPTADDVIAADRFKHLVTTEGTDRGADKDARQAAILYAHQVANAALGAAQVEVDPPLADPEARLQVQFDQLDQRMAQMDQRMDQIDQRMDQMDQCLDQTNERMGRVEGLTARSYIMMIKRENQLYIPGDDLAEVPFADGTFPWGKQVHDPSGTRVVLPELKSVACVKALTMAETYGYFRGYFPDEEAMPSVPTCRQKILIAIGRRDDIPFL